MYQVLTMRGDWHVEDQPNWTVEFEVLDEAIQACIEQHKLMIADDAAVYSMVCSEDGILVHYLIWKGRTYTADLAQQLADELAEQDE